MMRTVALLLAGLLLFAGIVWAAIAWRTRGGPAPRPASRPALAEDVTMVIIHPANASILYAGSRQGVFGSEDDGRHWRRVLPLRGEEVFDLAAAPSHPSILYVATSRGLYRSDNAGGQWQLRTIGPGGNDTGEAGALAVAVHPTEPHTVIVGTRRGVTISRDGGVTWQVASLGTTEGVVRAIRYDPDDPAHLVCLAASGLYHSADGGQQWARLLVQAPQRDSAESDLGSAADAVTSANDAPSGLKTGSLALDPTQPQRLFVGTSRGVWASSDGGATWQALPSVGLGHPTMRHLLVTPDDPEHLWAATSAGLFLYTSASRTWRPVREGLAVTDVRWLAWSSAHRSLWVATAQGLFLVPVPSSDPDSSDPAQPSAPATRRTLGRFAGEPTITQVQAAAIEYAEVMPQKIQSWRTRAMWRSWIPKFTVGINQDSGTTIGSSSSNGKTTFTVGPDDRSLGVNYGFTWDLANLVWNPEQTSIDTRSRLMVQLRNDILDDVTRVYFERRRLQVEYAFSPASDPTLQVERQLRIEELTAQLDALTGGDFSQNNKKDSGVRSQL